jgi:hypothetical protein
MGIGGARTTLEKDKRQEPVERDIPIPIPLALIYLSKNLLVKILNEDLILAHQKRQHYAFR